MQNCINTGTLKLPSKINISNRLMPYNDFNFKIG
jgi:hypothetical protein